MVTCPRYGNDAEYLADDTFVLIRCEFCGDDIDAADLVPPGRHPGRLRRTTCAPVT